METKKKIIQITKKSGEVADFSTQKVEESLRRAGADQSTINTIVSVVKKELYEGITTTEIYNRAFNLLKKKNSFIASRYKLKKAIYELGPTGFPFERFVAAIFKHSGFKTEVSKIIPGKCVTHEVDVVAVKDEKTLIMECKFHGSEGKKTDVKVPLYIDSRFRDIKNLNASFKFNEGWVVTNTVFTEDAEVYAKCTGLHLLSWNLPPQNALRDRIDHTGLYPITVSTLLSSREKQFLLSRDVVLCKELINDKFYLDHLGVSENRQKRILKEMEALCKGF
ncbi:MAG: restriction endonuclease [Flavobacteriaceae bacterium]|nr:restriction endonuclease [Flavobacteriaceae bacterium]